MPPERGLIYCPYNQHHQVRGSNLANHRKRCPDRAKFQHCPYNSAHVFVKGETDKHLRKCPDYERYKLIVAQF